jgi:hypothetical protein
LFREGVEDQLLPLLLLAARSMDFEPLGIVTISGIEPPSGAQGTPGQVAADIVLAFEEDAGGETALSETSESEDEVRLNLSARRTFRVSDQTQRERRVNV